MIIRRLPKEVVERIAAGEVIERPASVVKELVENALDAGATRVEVEVEKGGKQRLVVSDNGAGLDADDLELAFVAHATSKLTDVEDLLSIASYGFRGEALASIGAVSKARIRSRTPGADSGREITCEGGVVGEVRPCAASPGTQVEAQHLYYNVPARARFMKGDPAEAARCLDAVLRFALVGDGVAFRFTTEGRVVLEIAEGADRVERFAAAYGPDLARGMIHTEGRQGDIHVEALLGAPAVARTQGRHQLLYLNGRVVKDATLATAVRQAYREFLAPTLQPVFAIFLTMDPSEVDVNVHPAKTEVRFRDSSQAFRAVYHVVLDALRDADLAVRPAIGGDAPAADSTVRERAETPSWSGPRSTQANLPRPPSAPRDASPSVLSPLPAELLPARGTGSEPLRPAASIADAGPREPTSEERSQSGGSTGSASHSPVPPAGARGGGTPAVPPRTGRGVLRLFETYLLYESDGELVVVDQHALHERVLYERLRRQLVAGQIASQRLLIPAVVEVGRAEVIRAEELAEAFAAVGLSVEPFGETSLAIHAMPAVLKRGRPEDLLRAVLAAEHGADRRALATLEEPLHTMACKAAVKAGDHLDVTEMEALLAEAEQIPEAKACPHGRPTAMRMSKVDMERWFKRSGF